MSGTIWSKFFWSDWLSDIGLRRCSAAARGVWMDMLCIAAQHDPIGYIAIGGEKLSVEDIAKIVGVPATEASTLLDELDRNGVFSRNRTGMIYCRRMINESKKTLQAKENGRLGGNPTLRKKGGNSASDNPPLKPPDKGPLKGRLKTHKPESRVQIPESAAATEQGAEDKGAAAQDSDLQKIEDACQAALPAEATWRVKADLDISPVVSAIRAGADLLLDVVPAIQAVSQRATTERRQVGRWSYFVQAIEERKRSRVATTGMPKTDDPHAMADAAERQNAMAGLWARHGDSVPWPNTWGGKPGTPGCRIPEDILRRHGIDPTTGAVAKPERLTAEK